jgi:hypothetical protein
MEAGMVFFKSLFRETRQEMARRKKARELFAIAQRFNLAHSNAGMLVAGRWMCPVCNEVHRSTEISFLTGPQYPACCRFQAGHRMFSMHATTKDTPDAAR